MAKAANGERKYNERKCGKRQWKAAKPGVKVSYCENESSYEEITDMSAAAENVK